MALVDDIHVWTTEVPTLSWLDRPPDTSRTPSLSPIANRPLSAIVVAVVLCVVAKRIALGFTPVVVTSWVLVGEVDLLNAPALSVTPERTRKISSHPALGASSLLTVIPSASK